MRKRQTTMKKKYDLLQQLWLTQKDVQDLAECGSARAVRIRKDIENQIAPKTLPEKIPTSLLVEYLDIDVSYIYRLINCSMQPQTSPTQNKRSLSM